MKLKEIIKDAEDRRVQQQVQEQIQLAQKLATLWLTTVSMISEFVGMELSTDSIFSESKERKYEVVTGENIVTLALETISQTRMESSVELTVNPEIRCRITIRIEVSSPIYVTKINKTKERFDNMEQVTEFIKNSI